MKKLIFLFLLAPFFSKAQNNVLIAEGVSPNLYVNHVVAAKENFYSIGRIYNISPKEIAAYNNLKLDGGLNLEQELKIPLTGANFYQSGKAGAGETFVPVFYIVKEKEGLYRVSVNHNAVPMETLKKWNNLPDDGLKLGTRLIVGYLKVDKGLSYLAKFGVGNSIDKAAVPAPETVKTPEPEKKVPVVTEPVVTKVEPEKKTPIAPEKNEQVKPKPQQETEILVTRPPKKEVPKTAKQPKQPAFDKEAPGGAFKSTFEAQTMNASPVETTAVAGIFKSTSGWIDRKFYCLYNEASQGTILKITNPVNGTFIYAKVLDLIPDLKQNNGLSVIISNAAADELGITENNAACQISYSK